MMAWLPAAVALAAPLGGVVAWPRRRAAAAAWVVAAVLAPLALRPHAGPLAMVVVLVACVFAVRALDAAAARVPLSRLAFALYVVDVARALSPVAAPARALAWARLTRAAALLAASAGLIAAGAAVQPWRASRYLDDLWMLVECAALFTGLADLVVGAAWLRGAPVPDAHDATFAASRGLADFWGRRWNRAFGACLARVTSRAVRRPRGWAVLATFALSGAVHAAPMVVAFVDPRRAAIATLAALAFFVVHGAAVALEGALGPRRRRGRWPRALFWAVWAATAPLYVPAMGIACGLHGRPFETLTFLPGAP